MKKLVLLSFLVSAKLILSVPFPPEFVGPVTTKNNISERIKFLINLIENPTTTFLQKPLKNLSSAEITKIAAIFHPDKVSTMPEFNILFTEIFKNLQQYLAGKTGKTMGGGEQVYSTEELHKATEELESLINGYETEEGRTAPFKIAAPKPRTTMPAEQPTAKQPSQQEVRISDWMQKMRSVLDSKNLNDIVSHLNVITPDDIKYINGLPKDSTLKQAFLFDVKAGVSALAYKIREQIEIIELEHKTQPAEEPLLKSLAENIKNLKLLKGKYDSVLQDTYLEHIITNYSDISNTNALRNKFISDQLSGNKKIYDILAPKIIQALKKTTLTEHDYAQLEHDAKDLEIAIKDTNYLTTNNPDIKKIISTLDKILKLKNIQEVIEERTKILEELKQEGFLKKFVRTIKSIFSKEIDTADRIQSQIETAKTEKTDIVTNAKQILEVESPSKTWGKIVEAIKTNPEKLYNASDFEITEPHVEFEGE